MSKTKSTSKKPAATEQNPHDNAVNPIAKKMQGFTPGITGAPTEPGVKQESEEAKQPEVQGEVSELVVNPVAPPVEPQGVPEALVRETATPNAQDEPTFHTGGDYGRLKAAFEHILERSNYDHNQKRELKEQAGIL
jgi:hypothetical protein